MKTTLYVYDVETNKLVAEINGDTNAECEDLASELYGDEYGWTYTPAFGFSGGLI
jgi:hypothetical protein